MLLVSTLSVGNASFNLAAGAAGFTVTRSGDLTPVVDVGYAVTDGTATSGTNYTSTAPTGTLQFASGQTTATIPLTILSNNFLQSTRDFTVDLTGVVDAFGPPATFAAPQTFATAGTRSVSVTEADVNGDGRPDLIVANQGSATVSVLMNTTAAGRHALSFAAQQTFATGSYPDSVAVADVNGDGKPDLIVTNSGLEHGVGAAEHDGGGRDHRLLRRPADLRRRQRSRSRGGGGPQRRRQARHRRRQQSRPTRCRCC